MKKIKQIQFHAGSQEELLPDFGADFPYIASRAELDRYVDHFVPWHWHKAVELFYVESGAVEYNLPGGKISFPAGSGGLLNSNILHATRGLSRTEENVQFCHIFDPALVFGGHGSRIEEKYVLPLITVPQVEMIALYPEDETQKEILRMIRSAFEISEQELGYEIHVRGMISEIWLSIFKQAEPLLKEPPKMRRNNDKIKDLMIYVHQHYAEKIAVSELAASVFLSERECFRIFQECLHMTPMQYIQNYRLQMASQMLAETRASVTEISHACGLGSSSYFGKVFREYRNCTPGEYRQKTEYFAAKGKEKKGCSELA